MYVLVDEGEMPESVRYLNVGNVYGVRKRVKVCIKSPKLKWAYLKHIDCLLEVSGGLDSRSGREFKRPL